MPICLWPLLFSPERRKRKKKMKQLWILKKGTLEKFENFALKITCPFQPFRSEPSEPAHLKIAFEDDYRKGLNKNQLVEGHYLGCGYPYT